MHAFQQGAYYVRFMITTTINAGGKKHRLRQGIYPALTSGQLTGYTSRRRPMLGCPPLHCQLSCHHPSLSRSATIANLVLNTGHHIHSPQAIVKGLTLILKVQIPRNFPFSSNQKLPSPSFLSQISSLSIPAFRIVILNPGRLARANRLIGGPVHSSHELVCLQKVHFWQLGLCSEW